MAWTKHVLATTQLVFSDYAMGPAARVRSIQNSVRAPETVGEKALCASQKMHKTGDFA